MNKDFWNPQQYEKFKSERSRPFWDLVAMVKKAEIRSAIDLGCGTGELTAVMHNEVGSQFTIGMDSSPAMLDKAKAFTSPCIRFERAEIENFKPEKPFDLVFSNAALQWVPEHERVLPVILNWVAPGGQVALQMPFNFDHPSHRIAREVARQFLDLESMGLEGDQSWVLPVERYAQILATNGFIEQRCRIEVYLHPMPSGSEVIEWTKGTRLTSYQKVLSESEFAEFLKIYSDRLLSDIGHGPYLYAFKRILLWGQKDK